MMYLWLIIGFVLLIKGADFFVEGSSGIAKAFKVPSMIIGLTIVAMGTSAPELSVSISAAMQGSNAIAISNVIGSNIFNLIVVCGVCAMMSPLPITKATLKSEFPIAIGAGILLLIFCLNGRLDRMDGIIFLVLFAAFLAWMIKSALDARKRGEEVEEEEIKSIPIWQCLIYIAGGLLAIVKGGDLVVASATDIARTFGLSETLIGLTIVAIGTSLPELVTSVVAAKKGEVEMAIGNVVGSNIFNILLILGVSSSIMPIPVLSEAIFDLALLTAMSMVVYVFGWSKQKINRLEGVAMVGMYVLYSIYICMR